MSPADKLWPAGPRLPKDSLLTSLMGWAEAISAIQFNFTFMLFLLYLIGNFQEFSPAGAFMILQLLSFFSFSAVLVNGYSLVIIAVWSLRHHKLAVRNLVVSAIRMGLGVLLALTGPTLHAILLPTWVP